MPLYLSQQTLKQAIDRLSVSAATSSLADYLIFKRAFKLSVDEARAAGRPEPTGVVTGTKASIFVQAIEELTLRITRGSADPKEIENPYYLPFESKRDRTLGYRTSKYPSNGSSDTASRWQARGAPPLTLVAGTSPKEFKFEQRSERELGEFFVVKGATEHFSGEKPRLLDAAVWWFRFTDLAERFDGEPDEEQLVQAFLADFGLTEGEISALFTGSDGVHPNLAADNAEPREES
jgi:hypothetical protein